MATASAVRSALKKLTTGHATILMTILDNARVGPLKTNPQSYTRERFGEGADDYPALGKKVSPFAAENIPSLPQIHEFCMRELEDVRGYFAERPVYYTPHIESDSEDILDPSIQTIQGLVDDSVASETIVSFPSKTLDELRVDPGHESATSTLRFTPTKCTIIPTDTILPLQHSNEGTTTTTLLHGEVIWIIWPPTPHNLSVLTAAYSGYIESVPIDTADKLEGGVMCIQSAGEALRIPPFCPIMGLSTKVTILATQTATTMPQFLRMLQHLEMIHVWFDTEIDGEKKRSNFTAGMLKALDALLNGAIKKRKKNHNNADDADEDSDSDKDNHQTQPGHIWAAHLPQFLALWDQINPTIATLIDPADFLTLKASWKDFWIARPGRKCALCGRRAANKKELRKHFFQQHWVGREDVLEEEGEDEE